ncbi:MAG: TetR family transcriptional regulator [Desulfobulbaceae bacterium A2]|nr:MAG: TetR family transcriptional regulator [Desulfobulbaceae bacterium A2]
MKSKGEATRERIIAEATRLVQQKGFQATSMADLVEATGLQKGCLYFHFTGKDDLLLAILEQAKADFFQLIDTSLCGDTPGERLENFFQGTLEFQKNAGFDCGCIFGNIALEMSGKDPRVAAFVKGLFDEWTGKICAVVTAAQASGELNSQVAPEILAQQIIMSLEGGIMLAKLEKNERPLRDCLASLRVMIGLHLG